MSYELWPHQQQTYDFAMEEPVILDTSSPGTGKTGAWARIARHRLMECGVSRVLVVCPKTLIESAWAEDLVNFTPDLTYSAAIAPNASRLAAFDEDTEVVIINVDAMGWLFDQGKRWWNRVMGKTPMLIVDESHTLKNKNAARTKAALKMADRFMFATCMSGTPAPKTITELWSQAYLLDGGQRLGNRFTKFRRETQHKVDMGIFSKWMDNDGAKEEVYAKLADISIGHKFDDVMKHVPEMEHHVMQFTLSPRARKAYEKMEKEAALMLEQGLVTAVNAAAMAGKLLQIASGAVYYSKDRYELIDTQRYDLIADLVEAREKTVLFYLWKHQRDYLYEVLSSRGLMPTTIASTMNPAARNSVVRTFQSAPENRALIMHPKTGAYGLTLTAATTTIFCSPVYEAAAYTQGCARIRRGVQARVTESIILLAKQTRDHDAYRVFTGGMTQMEAINKLFQVSK